MIPTAQFPPDRLGLSLPPTHELLVAGGDERIQIDPHRGVNKYGCCATPDHRIADFGSSTASTISRQGFAAADKLRTRLLARNVGNISEVDRYIREVDRLRVDLRNLCGLSSNIARHIIFAPSGTDLHVIASRLWSNTTQGRTLVIMVQRSETGSGVLPALKGSISPLISSRGRQSVTNTDTDQIDILEIPIRCSDGSQRLPGAIGDELDAVLSRTAERYQAILLVLTDVSKTGLLAPSPEIAFALRERWPNTLGIIVDACQFRLSSETLKAYLEHQCLVAITGSKFLGGPIFSGALLVPDGIADRLCKYPVDPALRLISSRAEWPRDWPGTKSLEASANYGLLLRWAAALEELRRFKAIPESSVTQFLSEFGMAILKRIQSDSIFELLPSTPLERSPTPKENSTWDRLPTIFPFLLYHVRPGAKRTPFSSTETRRIYDALSMNLSHDSSPIETADMIRDLRCRVGQPVLCGTRQDIEVSALRLCLSAPLIVEAISGGSRRVIDQAIAVLDKTALLARALPSLS
jgi:hypothetical protein